MSDVAFGLAWTTCGLVAWRLRPTSATGRLMTILGLVLFLDGPVAWRLVVPEPVVWLVTCLGIIGFWFQWSLGGHIVLTFPSGRTETGPERLFLRVAYVSSGVVAGVQLLLETPDRTVCRAGCPVSPFRIIDNRQLFLASRQAGLIWFGLLAVCLIVLLMRRARTSGSRWRRQRAVVAAAATTAVAGLALIFLGDPGAASTGTTWPLYVAAWSLTIVLPGAFLLGLVRDRAGYASVADLVRGLDGLEPRLLEPALARTLQDPGLRLVFPFGDGRGFVDGDGRPVSVDDPGSQRLTLLGAPDHPLAALLHDPVLAESPLLLESAAAAARLSLMNARLQAQIRAQLNETRASRARIVAAADEERQRIERNLHDGAQQRLVAVGITLNLMRSQLERDGAPTTYLSEVEAELRTAIDELRELAQGIHPAVLTDEGLVAALGMLVRRTPLPVTLDTAISERPTPQVEAAVYYIVSEALQNAAKHAHASRAVVSVSRQGTSLLVEVTDDGSGGATQSGGTGVRGIADRVAALDGSFNLESATGQGTHIRVTIPCE